MKTFETEDFFAKYEFAKPYMLSASDCESVSIEELIQAGQGSVEEFVKVRLGYPAMAGGLELRQEIASSYAKLNESQILVLGSPVEGIFLAMQALVEKGDHVVILSPAYDALFNVAEHVTGNVSRWFLKNDERRWRLDFEQLEYLMRQKTKLLVINFPHNPTGFLPSGDELNKLVEIADRYGVLIFADEIYRGLEYSSNDQLDSVTALSNKAVVLGGASKSLGLPGLRFGWLAIPDAELYQKIFGLKAYTSMCATQAGEYLGRMAIRAAPQLIEKNLNIIRENLQLAEAFFERWEHRLTWLPPKAGSVSLIKIDAPSAKQFCHDLADRFGVVLLPTKFMGLEDQYARIGFGRKNFKECLDAFDSALKQLT